MTRPATEKQLKLINHMLHERQMSEDSRTIAFGQMRDLTVDRASRWIDRLNEMPLTETARGRFGSQAVQYVAHAEWGHALQVGRDILIPDGRYAVRGRDGNITFYRVWVGDRGGWNVSLQVSDDLSRLGTGAAIGVLNRIADAGVSDSLKLYGHEIGSCGVCGRTLTNESSRSLGIGPVCAEKMGV